MEWETLFCGQRKRTQTKKQASFDHRSEFQKDYHRIICSASFRRLQDKTQVFSLDDSDFVRTRLTHSLEVASFARSLGDMVFRQLIEDGRGVTGAMREDACSILECAGLLHDIGNPPFGHFGEDSIRNWFAKNLDAVTYGGKPLSGLLNDQMKGDLLHFEGNAQALRLLSKLHFLVDENGMNLTFALLNTLIKYPVSSLDTDAGSEDIRFHKMGYYLAEQELFRQITEATGAVGCRYPLTFLLEAADDIAYKTADIEDAVKKGFISYHSLVKDLKSGSFTKGFRTEEEKQAYEKQTARLEEHYGTALERGVADPEENAVQNWVIGIQSRMLGYAAKSFTDNYDAIMEGSFGSELLEASEGRAMANALSGIAYQRVFRSKNRLRSEIAAGSMIDFLLGKFVPAAVMYEEKEHQTPAGDRLMDIISDNYLQIYRIYSEGKDEQYRLYLRLLLVTDYICGMTDSFAKRLFQELSGIK